MIQNSDFVDIKNETAKTGQKNSELRQYFCPHCRKTLIRGNIKKLRMECPHCQRMIDSPEKDLLKG